MAESELRTNRLQAPVPVKSREPEIIEPEETTDPRMTNGRPVATPAQIKKAMAMAGELIRHPETGKPYTVTQQIKIREMAMVSFIIDRTSLTKADIAKFVHIPYRKAWQYESYYYGHASWPEWTGWKASEPRAVVEEFWPWWIAAYARNRNVFVLKMSDMAYDDDRREIEFKELKRDNFILKMSWAAFAPFRAPTRPEAWLRAAIMVYDYIERFRVYQESPARRREWQDLRKAIEMFHATGEVSDVTTQANL